MSHKRLFFFSLLAVSFLGYCIAAAADSKTADSKTAQTKTADSKTSDAKTAESSADKDKNKNKDEDKDPIVYVTKTGKKYHAAGCRFLTKSNAALPLSEAAKRYAPCSVCKPPVIKDSQTAGDSLKATSLNAAGDKPQTKGDSRKKGAGADGKNSTKSN